MPFPVEARRARAADAPELARMLARAFDDDPVATWSCPRDAVRPWMLERFHAARLAHLLPHEEVWVAPDNRSAALWAPPKRWKTTPREDLQISRCMLHPRLLWRAPMVGFGMHGIERNHPPHPPHWYLATLGTDPAAQGQGLGTAVLKPVLERCDSEGLGAYLESSKESNLDYYARFGFRAEEPLRLPRGPRVWPMWREPLG